VGDFVLACGFIGFGLDLVTLLNLLNRLLV